MRVNFYALILAFSIAFTAKAQITHRDILQRYRGTATLVPQSQFKPFPRSPEDWKKILPDSVITTLIKRGEAALKKDFKNIPATVMLEFVRNGNRTDYERLSFEKRNQLWDLVMAESVDGKGRFTDQIVNGIWSICEESFWGISAHVGAQKAGAGLPDVEDPIVDLFAAETAAVMAWTDYFVGPQLERVSKLVRPRIRYEITRRIFAPMETARYGWMGGGKPDAKLNNWAPWIASNYLAAALLIEKDDTKRAGDLDRTIKIVDQYLNGLGVDGGCDEGPSYWGAAGGCVYDVLNLLSDGTAGRLNAYHDPFIQKMGSYIYKTHIAGRYFINVADAHPTLTPDGLMLYRFGRDMDDKAMMSFGSWCYQALRGEGLGIEQFHRTRGLYNLTAINATASYPAKEANVADMWYSDVQLMSSRSSDNGLFVASHGGNNGESHNHNDVGDFVVYANGYPVIIDVGSGTYTARTFGRDRYKLWFNTSAYHNLPVVNGKEQGTGGIYAAADVKYAQSKNITTLSMDIAKAYPAGAGIKSWVRTVKMDKTKGIEVTDKYEMNAQLGSLTQSLMSVSDVNTDTPGKITFTLPDKNHVYLDYDASIWTAKKEKIELTTPEDQGVKHSWEGRPIWRVLLVSKSAKMNGVVKYFIHK